MVALIIFCIIVNMQEDKLSVVVWINIALGSTLGSAGAAPVPNAGVIMLITVNYCLLSTNLLASKKGSLIRV
jgi:Na+/H+-dicarboxylate symporter